ncbi:hypothetical protein EMCRGX_G025532 [Ephydatia muelleri]
MSVPFKRLHMLRDHVSPIQEAPHVKGSWIMSVPFKSLHMLRDHVSPIQEPPHVKRSSFTEAKNLPPHLLKVIEEERDHEKKEQQRQEQPLLCVTLVPAVLQAS